MLVYVIAQRYFRSYGWHPIIVWYRLLAISFNIYFLSWKIMKVEYLDNSFRLPFQRLSRISVSAPSPSLVHAFRFRRNFYFETRIASSPFFLVQYFFSAVGDYLSGWERNRRRKSPIRANGANRASLFSLDFLFKKKFLPALGFSVIGLV